jgi:hypothetical protein
MGLQPTHKPNENSTEKKKFTSPSLATVSLLHIINPERHFEITISLNTHFLERQLDRESIITIV